VRILCPRAPAPVYCSCFLLFLSVQLRNLRIALLKTITACSFNFVGPAIAKLQTRQHHLKQSGSSLKLQSKNELCAWVNWLNNCFVSERTNLRRYDNVQALVTAN
jgi:hypothetical protein